MCEDQMNEINFPENHFKHSIEYRTAKNLPASTIEQYIRNCHIGLGNAIRNYVKIYLDLKYWIYFRDVELGTSSNNAHKELYDLLKRLVHNGIIICPASTGIYMELFKQNNMPMRRAGASIIEKLSRSISIRFDMEVFAEELLTFMLHVMEHKKPNVPTYYPTMYSFTSLSLGFPRPVNKSIDPKTLFEFQKICFDRMTNIPFTYFIEQNSSIGSSNEQWEKQVKETEEKERLHRKEFATFEEVYDIELAGFFSDGGIFQPAIKHALMHILWHYQGYNISISSQELEESAELYNRMCYNLLRLRKQYNVLPSVIVETSLFALRRYLSRTPHKGDIFDYIHASVAVPHCDMFFTESQLGTSLVQGLLNFDKRFKCRILWKDDKILELLKTLP